MGKTMALIRSDNVHVIVLLGIAFILRVLLVLHHPEGINLDEASNLYDAWSIAETGADRFDTEPPISSRAFGESDYRPAFFNYVTGFVFRGAGISLNTLRFVSVFFGIMGALLFYRLTLLVTHDAVLSKITLFISVLMPWHITLSVIGHEGATFAPFFFVASVYFSLLWRRSTPSILQILGLALLFSLYSYTYQSSRIISFLLALEFGIYLLKKGHRRELVYFLIVSLLLVSPHLYQILAFPDQFVGRYRSVSAVYDPFPTYGWIQLLEAIFSYISPKYLFFNTSEVSVFVPFRLLPVSAPFFYLGLFSTFRNYSFRLFLLALFISILPALFATCNPNPIRTSTVIYVFPFFVALGLKHVAEWRPRSAGIVYTGYVVASIYAMLVLSKLYFGDPNLQKGHSQDLSVTYAYVAQMDDKETIWIDQRLSLGYSHYLWYNSIPPEVFKAENYRYHTDVLGWDKFKELRNLRWMEDTELVEKLFSEMPGEYILVADHRILPENVNYKIVFTSPYTTIIHVSVAP